MSVLNKYNQRVIAILGTITIVALSVLIILASYMFVSDYIDNYSYEPRESGLTMETVQKGDSVLRDQAITFRPPVQVDSVRQLYVLPVSQVELEDSEYVLGILNTVNSRKLNVDRGYYDLNNLVLYDAITNESTPLFSRKTNIQTYDVVVVNDKPFLIISAGSIDTDKNGLLNDADLQSLYIYDVLEKRMHPYEFSGRGLDGRRVIREGLLYTTGKVVALFTLDKNGNGRVESSSEPNIPMIISLKDFTIKEMITESMTNKLQRIVD